MGLHYLEVAALEWVGALGLRSRFVVGTSALGHTLGLVGKSIAVVGLDLAHIVQNSDLLGLLLSNLAALSSLVGALHKLVGLLHKLVRVLHKPADNCEFLKPLLNYFDFLGVLLRPS